MAKNKEKPISQIEHPSHEGYLPRAGNGQFQEMVPKPLPKVPIEKAKK